MKLKPPNHVQTTLDIFMSQQPTFSNQNINHFNNPFWQKFNQNQLQNTTFPIPYIQNHHYHHIAFHQLISLLRESKTHL
ncbi:accessory Sec system protein Asp2, partial [Staphylococcus epidermidis]|uniref:accessory Sec system protein Asp2 n=1 Tax=Staphylococcus epidermidis TaxID=1282 RepID=UPI0028CB6814